MIVIICFPISPSLSLFPSLSLSSLPPFYYVRESINLRQTMTIDKIDETDTNFLTNIKIEKRRGEGGGEGGYGVIFILTQSTP